MKTDVTPLAPSCLGLSRAAEARRAQARLDAYAHQLARIEAAFARMEAGRYGFCLACEGRIALTRLEADPAEAVCETCDESEDA